MSLEVKVPSVGESVQEGSIYKWHKNTGEYVEMDDVIVELETDKATVEIVAEASGVIETMRDEGDTVNVGDTLAKIDTAAAKPAGGAPAPKEEAPAANGSNGSAAPVAAAPAPTPAAATPTSPQSSHLSPAVQRMVKEYNLDPASIPGTGKGGRVTKTDVVNYMENPQAKQAPAPTSAPAPAAEIPVPVAAVGDRSERREKMSRMRKVTAERMIQAQENAAILTTFNEVDMGPIMSLRKQYKESFKEKHGVGLGFMSFFLKAAVEALQEFPDINGWIEGDEIVYHNYYDIGVAVASDRGLVVPVVRDVDRLTFAGIEATIANYAQKARAGKITIDDMTGGTFTISNGGVFGSLMSTPILNPPQSAILGMHKIQERAMVVNGEVKVRPMMYLALSYDHRIVDGKGAVSFLVKIKDALEDPTRLLLGV